MFCIFSSTAKLKTWIYIFISDNLKNKEHHYISDFFGFSNISDNRQLKLQWRLFFVWERYQKYYEYVFALKNIRKKFFSIDYYYYRHNIETSCLTGTVNFECSNLAINKFVAQLFTKTIKKTISVSEKFNHFEVFIIFIHRAEKTQFAINKIIRHFKTILRQKLEKFWILIDQRKKCFLA